MARPSGPPPAGAGRARYLARAEAYLTAAKRVAGWLRPAWVEVDLGAVTANVALLGELASPAAVCAVVKADGYGHGAVQVAFAALAGGATHLGVALAEEGHELRQAGIDAPILVLSEPPPEAMRMVAQDNLTATLYTWEGLAALVDATNTLAASSGAGAPGARPLAVHLKVDTGMHRVGASPEGAIRLARAITAEPTLVLEGLFTHLAVADEPGSPFTAEQLGRFQAVVAALGAEGIRPILHAANSAGALAHPAARYDMVRPGIAVYGLAPAPALQGWPGVGRLAPVLALKAQVSLAKEVEAGQALSYGLRYRLSQKSVVATVPIGYADGLPRRLSQVGGEVLIGGQRRPLAGTVTMDQILVDCGPGAPVKAGDEVVLIGSQGDEVVTAWEWADRLGTIAYEVTCALSARLPRVYI